MHENNDEILDHYHQHPHENYNNVEETLYKSFITDVEIPLNKVISYDKEDVWKSLTIEKARNLINNQEENNLTQEDVMSLISYLAIKYSLDNLVELEIMFIAKLITYELNQAKKVGVIKENNEILFNNKKDSNILYEFLDLAGDSTKSSDYRVGVIDSIKILRKYKNFLNF
jgi:hypothetical protein